MSDVDDDGDLDVYVANDTNPNRLYVNEPWPGGPGSDPEGVGFRFVESGVSAGVADENSGMGIASGDYDRNGMSDLFVTNFGSQTHSVFMNETTDEPSYRDGLATFGVSDLGVDLTGWGVVWADFDLDTDLDLVIVHGNVPVEDLGADAQPIQLFESRTAQGNPGEFRDVTEEFGLLDVEPLNARGAALADYDNDGDPDLAVGTIGGPVLLLENRGATGNWLVVDLQGFHPGAVVTVTLPDGMGLRREVLAGSSYLSSEDPRLHFGLAQAGTVDVKVLWPDGSTTAIDAVAVNQVLTLERAEDD
jgi:hypothetical protein